MIYYLFTYLDQHFNLPGAGVFQFISFRAALALFTSLLISMVFGRKIIKYLQFKQVGEIVRDLGLEGQLSKQGTPTMGGLIILTCILIPTLLFAKLDNVYIVVLIISTVWLGLIGFLDDYIKVFKKNKEGLSGRFKIIGQVGIGLLVGLVLYFNPHVTLRREIVGSDVKTIAPEETLAESKQVRSVKYVDVHEPITTIPFVKNHEFNYAKLISFFGEGYQHYAWLVFIPMVIFVVTAVSNGANMTDGLDGLAAGTTAIIGFVLAVFAYISGNIFFADYLNVMYLPNSGEIVIYMSAFIGACVGFLWYNSFPAQIFMGDTGSLALGGIVAVVAIALRKELLIPIFCGIYLVENLSVMLQVSYFKYTRKKFGEGRRIFKMAPLHHHYQKLGLHEAKIVARFWIVGVALAVLTIITLKLR
jgi:phospho-N-acetylmuramoyl-pentapeptide-transferase